MELWSHQKFRCTFKVVFNIETFVYDDEGKILRTVTSKRDARPSSCQCVVLGGAQFGDAVATFWGLISWTVFWVFN
jgi:hypothetical protein